MSSSRALPMLKNGCLKVLARVGTEARPHWAGLSAISFMAFPGGFALGFHNSQLRCWSHIAFNSLFNSLLHITCNITYS
jgi:hypothetical protein